jgi:hypothetical protein
MKITKQKLRQIIKEEIAAANLADQYVQERPEAAARMLEDLLQGISLIHQQATELRRRFNDLDPHERDLAAHGLQETGPVLERAAKDDRISRKIAYLIDKEGKPKDQAVAIAHSMEERGEL